MEKIPYLVQRLERPYEAVTFPVPKELEGRFTISPEKREKLSEKNSRWLRNAIRGDYMGCAEFEFNSVPKGFHMLAQSCPTIHDFQITGSRKDWKIKVPQKERTVPIFLFCNESILPEVKGWITKLAKDDFGESIHCKAAPYINQGLFDPQTYHIGWFDIDLLWVATTSQDLCLALEALCKKPS